MQQSIIEDLGTTRAADIIEEMDSDDAADLLGELDEERRAALLAKMETASTRASCEDARRVRRPIRRAAS